MGDDSKQMSPQTIKTLKATAPAVKAYGMEITQTMYMIMIQRYPEVKNYFNMSHFRKTGDSMTVAAQPKTLANAIIAFAAYADNLTVLNDAVATMTHKHVSFDIKPEHYAIVGECILEAIKTVLGSAASKEVIDAWTEGYNFLADLLIGIETKMKKDNADKRGGWYGYKFFTITQKVPESQDIVSFYLKPSDGAEVAKFQPGQYLSIRFPKGTFEEFDHDVVRNYSLSSGPGKDYYRISLKKEVSNDLVNPDGLVSSYFHDKLNVGSQIEVGMPCGSFVLASESKKPIVLIAGGVGLTPMISMLESLLSSGLDRNVVFVQCTKSPSTHAMRTYVDDLSKDEKLSAHVYYSTQAEADSELCNTRVHYGKFSAEDLANIVAQPASGNDYYFCGPPPFLGAVRNILEELKVPKNQIHYEYFGPTEQ